MQHNYLTIKKLEIELKQLEEAVVPERPRKFSFYFTKSKIFLNVSKFFFFF